mgnify:FL=1
MKNTLLLFTALLSFISLKAQFGSQQIISTETDKAYLSIPVDIDNDGFIDVLSAQAENHVLVWFKNLNGLGSFGPKTVISTDPALYLSVDYVDIDTDGDKDILFIENNPRQIRWIEHLDGQGTFGEEHLIASIEYIKSIRTLDFDNDGDLDIISTITNTFSDGIVWFENENSLGTFGGPQLLINGNTGFYPPILEDIDNDGDIDILTSLESYNPSTIVWFENNGDLSFSLEHEILQFNFIISDWTSVVDLKYVDIDTDGLKDIFFETYQEDNGSSSGWLKNINNTGTFEEGSNIIHHVGSRKFYDLDDDGDLDMLLLNRNVNTISWIENSNGLGVFNPIRVITTEIDFPRDTQAADIDGDGLLDVVSASLGDDKVAWYKNSGILGVEESKLKQVLLYPNPTNGTLYLNTSETIVQAKITSISGKLIKTIDSPSFIDLTELSSGIYFVTLTSDNDHISVEKIIKK